MQYINPESIVTTIVIAIIFAFVKIFRDVDQIKTAHKYEVDALKSEIKPVVAWFEKTSMDAIRIATNPTSQRLKELGEKYIACIRGEGEISVKEKQELIDGLREILRDPKQFEAKRQSASMSLRFIEQREGMTARGQGNH